MRYLNSEIKSAAIATQEDSVVAVLELTEVQQPILFKLEDYTQVVGFLKVFDGQFGATKYIRLLLKEQENVVIGISHITKDIKWEIPVPAEAVEEAPVV